MTHPFFGIVGRGLKPPKNLPPWYRDYSGRREREYRIRFIRRRKKLCIRCGQPRNPESRSLCDKHLDWFRDRQRTIQGYKGLETGRPPLSRTPCYSVGGCSAGTGLG